MASSETASDRRAFFQRVARKTGETVVRHADAHVSKRASHWIRPPHALAELDFLLACTRCGDCTAACPHDVIFALPTRLGAQIAATPALDLLHRGCHCCSDWPCVAACESGALSLPADENGISSSTPPKIASAQIDGQLCLAWQGPECGACASACPIDGALIWQNEKPRIDIDYCNGCALCREACIVEPKAISIRSLSASSEVAA